MEESRTARRRLVERSFLIVRPKEALLLPTKPTRRTPGAGSTQGQSLLLLLLLLVGQQLGCLGFPIS